MLRWGPRVPHPCLDRLHAAISCTPEGGGGGAQNDLFYLLHTCFQLVV